MSSAELATEGFFQKYAWILLLANCIVFILFGVGDIIQGMDADTSIAEGITGVAWEESQTANPDLANLVDVQTRAGSAHLIIIGL